MVVKVLVHKDGPLFRFERTKERMRMRATPGGARTGKTIDRRYKLRTLTFEVALFRLLRKKLGRGRGVTAKWFVVPENHRFDERADHTCGKGCTFRGDVAHCHSQTGSAVRECLCDAHGPPKRPALGSKAKNPLFRGLGHGVIKEVLHRSSGYNGPGQILRVTTH